MLSAVTFQGHSTKCHKTLDISQNLDENTHVHSFIPMTKNLMLSMLRQGSNGEEILKILDTIIASPEDDAIIESEPTLEWIEF